MIGEIFSEIFRKVFKQGSDRTAFPARERFDVNCRAPNTTYDAGPARTFSNLEPEQNT